MFRAFKPMFRPAAFSLSATILGVSGYRALSLSRPIACNSPTNPQFAYEPVAAQQQQVRHKPLLNYEHLTIGSFTGLLAGYVVGKLSKLIAVLFLTSTLTFQFLYSRGIISVPTHFIQWGKDRVDLRALLLENPSYKITFTSAFIIAAIYA